ncbi:MAG TPA: CheR family methyltransferase [Pyrinomonadaceae bacterium]|nr:CheR family methyltransferase [Pyrinomonadaceae bacterium]
MSDTSKGKTPKKSEMKKDDPPSSTPPGEQTDDKFLTVGLGASAGGIQALKDFFSRVTKDSGMAYVVILHMSPEHESKLAEILQVTSPIPVTQVKEREKIRPNHVYVIPPNQSLAITDDHLQLTAMIGMEERRSPVDLFFRTLAEANESRAVSVILSGTGANGSMGMKRIKEYGGIAFAQDPKEAEYADMPRNAIATGMVDYVLPVAEIPAKIISYKEHLSTVQLPEPIEAVQKTDEQALLEIFTQLRVRTGHDFSNYKRGTILRRIERRLGLRELPNLSAYSQYLKQQPEEVHALMKDLLISVTNFFRDQESIDALLEKVMLKLLDSKNPAEPIRVWVAGCATGEEAYSIAMLLSEQITIYGRPANLQVFATDLDEEAIQTAREGYYKEAEVADVSPERLRRFFNRESDGYRVRRELRESILFAVHNVIKDPPFSHLDLVSCRNLLIYLNRSAQGRVLEVLHFALNPGGHLFLGASESIEGAGDLFSTVDKEHHIFRSRPVPPRAFPVPEITLRPPLAAITDKEKSPEEKRAIERLSYADLHQRLLEQYAPPSVIVNEEYEVLHLSDRAGRYMQVSGGEPSVNLLKIVRPELRLELRTALYQAVHDRINVEAKGLRVSTDEGIKTLNILVRPVLREEDVTRGFVLVLFVEAKEETQGAEETSAKSAEPLARRLEEELVHSKNQLRATVEQYEIQQEELRASNEELQAMNEELRSAAEELETSKEELQSVNEELTTVNQELKIKIEELSQANNNFQNLMNSTNIGTIFLDRSLKVRAFTPTARETFNLIQSDIGRPLLDITNKLPANQLLQDIENVLSQLQIIEREVNTADNHSYMMKLLPYRTVDDKIDGVVITLVDVSELARSRRELQKAQEELESRVNTRTKELASANEALLTEASERAHVEDSRMMLLSQLVSAQEDERRRFALDLHDQLGQQLTALRIKLESMGPQIKTEPRLESSFVELQNIVKQLDTDVDFLAWQLRPVALDDLGLSAALESYMKQWSQHFGIEGQFHVGEIRSQRFDPMIETNLYRIAQEALNNCAKHSQCSRAEILLEQRDHHAVLIIEDNGVGFNPDNVHVKDGNWGLLGMRERAALLRGTVEIESSQNKGTTIYVRVPLPGLVGGESWGGEHTEA